MDRDELASILEEAGLSAYKSQVFASMLWLRDASVTQILDACSVPQPRIYDVLAELDDEGYVETYEEEMRRARMHDPSKIVGELDAKADRFRSAASRIEEVWEQPSFGQCDVTVFDDRDAVVDHAARSVREADASVQIAADVRTYVDLIDVLKTVRNDGVFVRLSLYEDDSFRFGLDDVAEYFEDTATVVKRRETPGPFLALVDGGDSYFGMTRSPVNDYGLKVDDQALSSMMYWFFQNSLWAGRETVAADESTDEFREYVEIRRCIGDVAPSLERGETVEATIRGYDTHGQRPCEITGEIVETIPSDDSTGDRSHADVFTARATVIVESGSERYSVGGFGAVLEDVRATKITVYDP